MSRPITYVRAWRRYRKLSARQLAELAGYHHSYIYKIEKGRKDYNQEFLERVAKVLDCTPADLLGCTPEAHIAFNNLTEEERAILANVLAGLRARRTPDDPAG